MTALVAESQRKRRRQLAASGSSGTLCVIGRRRRHIAHEHSFQRSDILDNPNCPVVQMDTVKGRKEKGAVILTMLMLKYDIMLLFRMPDCKASSVIDVFDFLASVLDLEVFHRLFPVVLTDNGSEFKKVESLEYACTGEQRCMLFYCDPMASWQKGELEKDHEYIRYVIPKGSDLNACSDDDIHLLMNHINSVKRTGLHGKCPYENVPPHILHLKIAILSPFWN